LQTSAPRHFLSDFLQVARCQYLCCKRKEFCFLDLDVFLIRFPQSVQQFEKALGFFSGEMSVAQPRVAKFIDGVVTLNNGEVI
jgi:hypothetical protein